MQTPKDIQQASEQTFDDASKNDIPIDEIVHDGKISGRDAKAYNVPSSHPQPAPVECEFCGKTLWYEGIYLWGNIIVWSPHPERCDCEKAAAYWAEEDARAAKEKAETEEAERRKRLQAKYERLLNNSGMGRRFQQRTFDTYIATTEEQQRAMKVAQRFADTFAERLKDGRGIYIEGSNGTGKTHLAAAIALRLMGDFRNVIFRTYGDLLDEVKRTFDASGGASEYELSQAFRNCDLLIIDDLGKEQCTDWSVSFLYGVINARYESMLPTIITTNYDAADLIRTLTPTNTGDDKKAKAIVSRLCETSVRLVMEWDDYRAPGKK